MKIYSVTSIANCIVALAYIGLAVTQLPLPGAVLSVALAALYIFFAAQHRNGHE